MRNAQGSTIIELLISSSVMSIITLAFMSILLINYKTNAKVTNVSETANALRTIKERLGKDVREGRSLGDVYGDPATDPSSGLTYNTGSATFPSANDPVYGGNVPAGGPYTLSPTTLVVQIPITDLHNDAGGAHKINANNLGWPTQVNVGGSIKDNVETHVYQIVPDPQNANEWLMQFSSFPGAAVMDNNPPAPQQAYSYDPAVHRIGPCTILKGIVGPLDSNNNPHVFQYLNRTAPNAKPTDAPTGQFVAEYTGVVVNLEVRQHQESSKSRTDISLQPVGMKTEVFLRNNTLATSTGIPVQP